MELKNVLKNVSGTVCVLGCLSCPTLNLNNTMVVGGDYEIPSANYGYHGYDKISANPGAFVDNICFESKSVTKLEQEAKEFFGIMRDATTEEQEGINDYIKSISKDTGVDFFNLC